MSSVPLLYNQLDKASNGENSSDTNQLPQDKGNKVKIRVWGMLLGLRQTSQMQRAMQENILHEVCIRR